MSRGQRHWDKKVLRYQIQLEKRLNLVYRRLFASLNRSWIARIQSYRVLFWFHGKPKVISSVQFQDG